MKKTITYREALAEGLRFAFKNDPRVFMMGEDIGKYGGPYGVTKGFIDEFGEDRIRDAPLSESGFTGAGIGAALNGMRPIVAGIGCRGKPAARIGRGDPPGVEGKLHNLQQTV